MLLWDRQLLMDCLLSKKVELRRSGPTTAFLTDIDQHQYEHQHKTQNTARLCSLYHKWAGKKEEIPSTVTREARNKHHQHYRSS
jgi:hypothetical protein